MTGIEIVVALAIAIGLLGIVVPVIPGPIVVIAAIGVWASEVGGSTAWLVFAAATGLVLVGQLVKFLIPGKRLKNAGVPNSTLLIGALLGLIGFFVIPVVGLFVGFVLGVYLAETRRLGRDQAWPSTKHALKATGLSILIELAFGMAATFVWITGLLIT